jgi:ABC-2 type transport system ATP-binding protein
MPAEYRERVELLARVVGLNGDIHRPLKTFSGGMKRKLEIIRSLMHRPGVLFLDEPTSGLDPVSRRGLWDYLRRVRNTDGTTVFLTTHYLEEAEEADRVCVIDHGRIAVIGTPDELKRQLLDRSVLIDAADRPALVAELRAMGLTVTPEPGGLLRVPYETATAQELIARIRTPLSILRVHEPSLEEAYVELLREPEEAVA